MRPIKASSDVSWTAGRKCGDATSRSTYWFCMTIPFSQPLIKLTNRRLLLRCYVVPEKWFRQQAELFRRWRADETKGKKIPQLFRYGAFRKLIDCGRVAAGRE